MTKEPILLLPEFKCNSTAKAQIHYNNFPVASPQQVRNDKFVASWRGQKSVVSVVSCTVVSRIIISFYNDLLPTYCELVGAPTSPQQVRSFPIYGKVTGKRV